MNIDSIKDGLVIDHIKAGDAMRIYTLLDFDKLDCPIAIIKNAQSKKMGKKDIIKIDEAIEINLDIIGYIAPQATVNVIRDGVIAEKKAIDLPEMLINVIKCKNPRCITTTEQEIEHIFKLTDKEKGVYRCIYCKVNAKE